MFQMGASVVGNIIHSVKEGDDKDRLNAFAPIVSFGLGALSGVPGIGPVANVASHVFNGTKAYMNIKDDVKNDKDALQKVTEILPEVISGAQAAIGLGQSASSALGTLGNAVKNSVTEFFNENDIEIDITGIAAGDVTPEARTISDLSDLSEIADSRTAGSQPGLPKVNKAQQEIGDKRAFSLPRGSPEGIFANNVKKENGASDEVRTHDLLVGNEMLYR